MVAAPAVRLGDVTLAYRRHPAVHHLTGTFAPGSFTAVVGPNGAGKSTLVKAIAGALRPASGRLELVGVDRRDIGYLPQAAEIDRSFPIAVADLVALGLWRRIGPFRRLRAAGAAADGVGEALAAVGLSGFERRPISTLSGGQMQRALFARLLLQDARLLLLDEPFTAIDGRTTADLLALVRRWHGEGRTVVAVLHDMDIVRAHIPETLLIAREPIAWGPTEAALSPENLEVARRMSEAWDEAAVACGRAA